MPTWLPEGRSVVSPYLVVRGAGRLIDFLVAVFGGQPILRVPAADGTLHHAEVRIGDSVVMLGDASAEHPAHTANLHVYVENADTAFGRALAAGATALAKPADQPYGDRRAAVTDAFGNVWWIATARTDGDRAKPPA
jgi:PhnB protein